MEKRDPIVNQDNKWYFWDEDWTNKYGPFESEGIARELLDIYYQCLNIETCGGELHKSYRGEDGDAQ